jgi:hypothetical protein
MKLAKANIVFQHQITEGNDFGWNCWPNSRFLDYESEWAHGSVVFSTVDQGIYEATVSHKNSDIAYRWLNPEWTEAMMAEADNHGVDHRIAWDNVRWIDLEVWDDFEKKAAALWCGDIPDSRVEVPLDISDEDFMHIARLAHERDVTINKMVEIILTEAIEREKRHD